MICLNIYYIYINIFQEKRNSAERLGTVAGYFLHVSKVSCQRIVQSGWKRFGTVFKKNSDIDQNGWERFCAI